MTTDPTVRPPPMTRFDQARADAAEAATHDLAIQIVLLGMQRLGRAASLLVPTRMGALGGVINRREVSRTLSAVIAELQEVVGELGE